jgi:hypothetical protein
MNTPCTPTINIIKNLEKIVPSGLRGRRRQQLEAASTASPPLGQWAGQRPWTGGGLAVVGDGGEVRMVTTRWLGVQQQRLRWW